MASQTLFSELHLTGAHSEEFAEDIGFTAVFIYFPSIPWHERPYAVSKCLLWLPLTLMLLRLFFTNFANAESGFCSPLFSFLSFDFYILLTAFQSLLAMMYVSSSFCLSSLLDPLPPGAATLVHFSAFSPLEQEVHPGCGACFSWSFETSFPSPHCRRQSLSPLGLHWPFVFYVLIPKLPAFRGIVPPKPKCKIDHCMVTLAWRWDSLRSGLHFNI